MDNDKYDGSVIIVYIPLGFASCPYGQKINSDTTIMVNSPMCKECKYHVRSVPDISTPHIICNGEKIREQEEKMKITEKQLTVFMYNDKEYKDLGALKLDLFSSYVYELVEDHTEREGLNGMDEEEIKDFIVENFKRISMKSMEIEDMRVVV